MHIFSIFYFPFHTFAKRDIDKKGEEQKIKYCEIYKEV